jgi:uncharacterized repeat protein (TIGR03943 family)
VRRETQNILLVLLGGALLKISFNGSYLRYVKSSQQAWLIAAGVVMVVLAAVSILRDVLGTRQPAEALAGHSHDHHGSSYSTWLLVLPVLAIFMVAPPSLGADSVARADGRAITRDPAAGNDAMFPPLEQGTVVPMRMSDFATRAAWDSSNALNDRTVRLVGFVVRQKSEVYLARMSIACCAADAFPIKVKMTGEGLSELANDDWLEVEATLLPGSATRDNQYVPSVTVNGLQSITEPTDPYEY